jgi:nitroreductase
MLNLTGWFTIINNRLYSLKLLEVICLKGIFNRRSIREFKDQVVEPEKIDKLLRAAMQAPSAANQQPWEFIVVKDKAALGRLSQVSPYSKPVAGSAITFVLLANTSELKVPTAWQEDMSAAA